VINPLTILESAVGVFSRLPSLSSALPRLRVRGFGLDPDNEKSIEAAVAGLRDGELLIAHMATRLGDRGAIPAWQHDYTAFFRYEDESEAAALLIGILDGVPSGYSLALQHLPLHEGTDPMEQVLYSRARNDDGIGYFTLTFTVTEIGG
jgi:hypothetical protein